METNVNQKYVNLLQSTFEKYRSLNKLSSTMDIDEDEGVATDATTDGNTGSKTKDIKANSGKTRSKFRENNRAKINKDDKGKQTYLYLHIP